MTPNFDHPPSRLNTGSKKWSDYPADVLPLWVADMDFSAPEIILQSLIERVNHGIFGYSSLQSETKEAVCHWLYNRHNWEVSPDQLVFLPGVVPGFNLAAQTLTEPGEGVLFQPPAYRPFYTIKANAALEEHLAPLTQSRTGKYLYQPAIFESAIHPHTKIFILCNPHNPTGRVFSRAELTSMAEICLDNQLWICADEIHSDLIFPNHAHIPIASLDKAIADRTITLLAPSKTFNIAGLKAAVAVITNPTLKKQFLETRRGLISSINTLGAVALTAAYTSGGPWLDELLAYLNQNRKIVTNFVMEQLPGCSIFSPEGTFLAWIDCRDSLLSNPQNHFLNEAKVALNPGTWFGERYEGFVRLNFGCSQSVLFNALQRMKDSLTK